MNEGYDMSPLNKTVYSPAEEKERMMTKIGSPYMADESKPIRQFESGATRDVDYNKNDYEACLSPQFIERFGTYMLSCSKMADGSKRPSDNWQKGIPLAEYMKSLMRHVVDVWQIHRGYKVVDKNGNSVDIENALCAVFFNTQGYFHEYMKGKK